MRKITFVAVAAVLMAIPLGALAGVGGPAFYVDGVQYRTVGTPTDFSGTGAPDHSFDTIYQFSGAQPLNVATAAPGDRGYNGGRWRVEVIGYASGESYSSALADFDANGSGDFDSAAEVEAAIAAGVIATSPGPSFECPVIPLPRNG
ncbi:MAG: hypothetical protein ACRDWH_00205 [Acidimicrobiia bacterium]